MATREDLEADIRAAIAETRGDPAPEKVETSAAEPTEKVEAPEAAAAPAAEDKAEKQANDGRARGPDGKFVKTDAEKAADKVAAQAKPEKGEAPKAAAPAAEPAKDGDKALLPPKDWSVEAKAQFMVAPDAVKKQMLDANEAVTSRTKEWEPKAVEYDQMKPVLDTHRQRWTMMGMTPAVAISRLLDAEKAIQNDPINGIAYLLGNYHKGNELAIIQRIAGAYGYALAEARQGDQPNQGQPQGRPAEAHPDVRRLEETIQKLTQDREREKAEKDADFKRTRFAEIDAFARDPKNLYFHNLRGVISKLVSDDENLPIRDRLQTAYDMAVRADPATWAVVQAEEQRKAASEKAKADAAKVAAAKASSGSTVGSPGPGVPAKAASRGPNSPPTDYRASIREAMAAHRA